MPDPLLHEAAALVIGSQFGSSAMLRRKLGVGPGRAEVILGELEHRGLVGPKDPRPHWPRAVLVLPGDLARILRELGPKPVTSARAGR